MHLGEVFFCGKVVLFLAISYFFFSILRILRGLFELDLLP